MEKTVFYSWQSDLPGNTNRNFIKTALEKAINAIRQDSTVEDAPRIDHDTAGEPGSPNIVQTIFNKIDNCSVFVCDVSFIDVSGEAKRTPNPNVLLELGYAIKTLGWERIVLVFNTAYGDVSKLPFDLRNQRTTTYNMTSQAETKSIERNILQSHLDEALRLIFSRIDNVGNEPAISEPSPGKLAITAVEDGLQIKIKRISEYSKYLLSEIQFLRPKWVSNVIESERLLIQAIDETVSLGAEFAQLTDSMAHTNDEESVLQIYKFFGSMIENCDPAKDSQGAYFNFAADFDRFIAYEFFVILVASLLQMRRWQLLAKLLQEPLYIHDRWKGKTRPAVFEEIDQQVGLLDAYYVGQSRHNSNYSEIIINRHNNTDIGQSVTLNMFVEAEVLLFLRSACDREKSTSRIDYWFPVCLRYISVNVPRFLIEAERKSVAEQLMFSLGINDIAHLRALIAAEVPNLRESSGNLRPRWIGTDFRPEIIGTK